MGQEQPARGLSLAQKLDRLFKTVLSPNGDEYTYREVAEAINAAGGATISWAYIHQLRTGKRSDPRKSHLETLAKFFGVSAEYFFDEERSEKIGAELDLLASLRESGVFGIATRAKDLSPEGKQALASVLETLRRAEGRTDQQQPEEQADERGEGRE